MGKTIVAAACMDRRIQKTLRKDLESKGYPEGSYYPIRIGGNSLTIQAVKGSLDVAFEKEKGAGLEEIWLFDHEDCAAYKYNGVDDSRDSHLAKLGKSKKWLQETYEVKVRAFFMSRIDDESWGIEEV